MRRVAITGFGVVSPIGLGRAAFWEALRQGTSGIAPITRFDAGTFEVRLAGEVKATVPLAGEAARLAALDLKTGFAFAACQEALAQAGITRFDAGTLLHLGTSLESFAIERIIQHGRVDLPVVAAASLERPQEPLQMPLHEVTALIANTFGPPGQALTNCSACAASAQAVGHGFRHVRSGRFDLAVCGGFDSMINPLGVGGFQLLGALTVDHGRGATACRPFDASRSGTVLGEGAAVFVLEPYEKARAAGKRVLAEICGYGSSLDAHNLSAPDPEGRGAMRAMLGALRDGGIEPAAIRHLSAHGTGTWLNDQIEAAAIRQVFAGHWEQIPVSAVKSMTGHTIGAAGAIALGACLLPLTQGDIPPNPHLKKVGKGCELMHVTEAMRFDGEYAMVNAFGFGGQNAALAVRKCHE